MKFVTNVVVLGLGRGVEFEAELTEYLAVLIDSEIVSIIQEKVAAPAPVDTGRLAAEVAPEAPQKRSEPRKRTAGTGTRKRAARKPRGVSDAV